jgi:DNA-binding IclR family transcriptional regulator
LAALPDDEITEVLRAREAERRAFGFTDDEVWETVASTRRHGHAAVEGRLINTMSAFGVPLFDTHGAPIAALSVASLVERLTDERRADIVAMLQREAAEFHAARRTRRL